jgi:hypothetical protein
MMWGKSSETGMRGNQCKSNQGFVLIAPNLPEIAPGTFPNISETGSF